MPSINILFTLLRLEFELNLIVVGVLASSPPPTNFILSTCKVLVAKYFTLLPKFSGGSTPLTITSMSH